MTEPGPLHYKVVHVGLLLKHLQKLASKAVRLGINQEFIASLREIDQRLTDDPVSWGDPIGTLDAAGLEEYHMLHSMLSIHYYVDRANCVVYLKQLRPVLSHPLAES